MAKAKQRKAKGNNGVGQFVSLTFDTSDPQEAAALAAAQLLASKHGRRKQAVVAFLSALYEVYQETGVLLSPVQIANAVQGVTLADRHAAMGFTRAVGLSVASEQTDGQRTDNGQTHGAPSHWTPPASSAPEYVPTELTISKAKKASAQEVGNNMLKSMAGFGFDF